MSKVESAACKPTVTDFSSCVGGRVRVRDILLRCDEGAGLVGSRVTVCGWVKTKREQGGKDNKIIFVELNDGSCMKGIQLVLSGDCTGIDSVVTDASTGASIRAVGSLVASPAKGQAVEVQVNNEEGHEVEVLGGIADPAAYPLSKKKHSKEFLRDIAHLRPRSNIIGAATRVRSSVCFAIHSFFREQKFQYIHTPLITSADCEGAGEMFQVTTMLSDVTKDKPLPATKEGDVDYASDFFQKPTFLTVSGQLAVENFNAALSDVYTFGPCFRAEKSHTSRHLAEFWMVEPELAFASLKDDMDCAEAFVKYVVKFVLDHDQHDLKFFDSFVSKGLIAKLESYLSSPFGRISYTEAIDILQDAMKKKVKFENTNIRWGMDMDSEHERYICEKVFEKPVIVHNYPKEIKAFYMRRGDDGKTVQAFDMLAPAIGELIGGSAREERLEVLDEMIANYNLDKEDYWWYRDLRRYGSVPHAGFGMGLDRMIMLCTGLDNIRDTIPYPRYPGHADF